MRTRCLLSAAALVISACFLGCDLVDPEEAAKDIVDSGDNSTNVSTSDVVGTWVTFFDMGGTGIGGRFDFTSSNFTYRTYTILNGDDSTQTAYVYGTWTLSGTMIPLDADSCTSFGTQGFDCGELDTAEYDGGKIMYAGYEFSKQ